MTRYVPRAFRSPDESDAVWASTKIAFHPVASSEYVFSHTEGRTAASQQVGVAGSIRPYTEEELKTIEEADRLPADLREQVKAFLEG